MHLKKFMEFKKLTPREMAIVDKLQSVQQLRMSEIPEEGIVINHAGKDFLVYRGVFIPFADSELFIKSYKINPGESVLDACTGCGIIAIFSAYKGASRVLATDINPEAIKCGKENAEKHGFSKVIETRVSDMYEAVGGEKFDVITANLPFRNKKAHNLVEATQWDTNLSVWKAFSAGLENHLNYSGRAYITQSNFGALNESIELAKKYGFKTILIGTRKMPPNDPRILYAFDLRRK